ncbi:L-rhamnonate dehydratase [Pseudactinotalea terrae]|uniref:L-rhamnonate dehydratase n=1 Tax=Pseudactinotalea terrae TaxID=1743262 RepID=UPI001390B6EF|nr:L-rhamnonate dehydratase [Pseudactinotalea terrae]
MTQPDTAPSELPDVIADWRRSKVANPMTRYPEFRDSRSAAIGRDSGRTVVVEVESASGHVGVGITNGGQVAAAIVELHLADMVEGQDPAAHERIWDRMFHSTLLYGRKGVVLHAISAVDLAVWDLHGQITGEPVYSLLGGPVHESLPAYATGPDVGAMARLGFAGGKLPLTWAPVEGEDGFRRNVERAEQARAAAGPDMPLYYDCWMSLDVDYATRLAWAIEPLGFRWLEEPLPPDDYAGHAELRRRMPPRMMLTTGEHEYTAAGFRLLCENGVDVLQPDPAWCGGLTELRRIAAVARSYGKRVLPHVGGAYSYHFLAAYPEAFLTEFPLVTGRCDTPGPLHGDLLTGEPLPVDGRIHVSDAPGFGLRLNPDAALVRGLRREGVPT